MSFHTECANGSPHIAYFDPDTQLAFCWSGSIVRPVEVCWGGAGEPVIDRIRVTADLRSVAKIQTAHTPAEMLAAFAAFCERYIGFETAAERDDWSSRKLLEAVQ